MMTRLTTLFHMMSDHGETLASKVINWVGLISITSGGTNAVVSKTIETQDETMLAISDWAGIVSIVGGCVFIFKLFTDMYFNYRKDQREAKSDKDSST